MLQPFIDEAKAAEQKASLNSTNTSVKSRSAIEETRLQLRGGSDKESSKTNHEESKYRTVQIDEEEEDPAANYNQNYNDESENNSIIKKDKDLSVIHERESEYYGSNITTQGFYKKSRIVKGRKIS